MSTYFKDKVVVVTGGTDGIAEGDSKPRPTSRGLTSQAYLAAPAQLRRMRGASSSATRPWRKTRTEPDVCETTIAIESVSREIPAAAM